MIDKHIDYLREKYGVIRIIRDRGLWAEVQPNHMIDLSGLTITNGEQLVQVIDDHFAALPPKPFAVGDLIETQEEADRLPLHTIVLSEDEEMSERELSFGGVQAVALQNYGLTSGNDGGPEWLMTGCEYHQGINRGLTDYLPVTILWLPPETKKASLS